MARIKLIHHINVQVSDRARTREWYEKVLGAEFLDRGPALNKRQLQLRLGSGEIHFTERVEVGEHRVPVIHLQGEVAGGDGGRTGRFREVDLAAAEAQLQLPLVQRRAAVEELRAEHLLVPFPGPRSITDLDVDVMDQLDPRHG